MEDYLGLQYFIDIIKYILNLIEIYLSLVILFLKYKSKE